MARPLDLSATSSLLGSCPVCGGRIPTDRLLIRYRTASGWPGMFAECPGCENVVHPV